MEPNFESSNLTITDLLEKKLQLQIETIALENKGLKKKWYKKPQWWAAILPGIAVLIVGIGTFLVALLTGYLSKQKAVNEDTNVLLEYKQDTLQKSIAVFKTTRDSLITENMNLKQNSAFVVQKINQLDSTRKLYDSAIKVQKGTIAERNKFVGSLIQQISNLKDKNEQLEQSIASLNSNTINSLAAFRASISSLSDAGGLTPSSTGLFGGSQMGGLQLGNVQYGLPQPGGLQTLSGQPTTYFVTDSQGVISTVTLRQALHEMGDTSLSRPLYIQDTSSAIYKFLHPKN